MKIGLFLDDERNPCDVTWLKYPDIKWVVVRNYQSFLEALNPNTYDVYSFDHDLQDYNDPFKERTGYDAIKMMVESFIEYDINPSNVEVYFHTQNPIGKENMRSYWGNFISYNNGSLYE